MRKGTVVLAWSALLIAAGVLGAGLADTIPPEILKKFDKGIVSGKRPKNAKMTQPDIFGLRSKPKFDADFVQLGFDPQKLSKVQKDIFTKWCEGGHNRILLRGTDRETFAGLLGTASIEQRKEDRAKLEIDNRAKPSVDVAAVESPPDQVFRMSTDKHYGIDESKAQDIAVVARYRDGVAAAGMFVARKTKVYFLPSKLLGPDADRLRLNFWHWALGLKVPGAANTKVSGSDATTAGNLDEQAKYDILSLRNGDTVSGVVMSKKVTVKASYGTIAFSLGKIGRVLVEGDGKNVDAIVLKNGDKITGAIQEEKFPLKLTNGKVINIAKDKIQEIVVQAKRGG